MNKTVKRGNKTTAGVTPLINIDGRKTLGATEGVMHAGKGTSVSSQRKQCNVLSLVYYYC